MNDLLKSKEMAAVSRQKVTTIAKEVPLGLLIWRPEEMGFRSEDELDSTAIGSLATDISITGVQSPLLVVEEADRLLVVNGHRRFAALQKLVAENVPGWTSTTLIRVDVLPANTSRLEMLARGISANVHQKALSGLGRAKAALALHKEGMPPVQIAGLLCVGEKSVQRDLSVAAFPRAIGFVKTHVIQFSTIAGLVEKAQKAKRVDDLFDAIEEFAVDTRRTLRAKNAELRSRGANELTAEKLWPQRYLQKARIAVWEKALAKDTDFAQDSDVQFSALVGRENGIQRIKVSALNLNVQETPLEHLKRVYERVALFYHDLGKALRDRANQVRSEVPESAGNSDVRDKVQADLQALGIADLVQVTEPETEGEDDPDFAETVEREDVDATVERPNSDVTDTE